MTDASISLFHFAQPLWLLGAFVIPAILLLYHCFYDSVDIKYVGSLKALEKFADKELIQHLLVNKKARTHKIRSILSPLILWSLLWLFLVIAMAGPRWSYREYSTFSSERSLVVLLDLSTSMNGDDVRPSRLARARQEIEDIVNLFDNKSAKVRIGLVAFALNAHMVSPITDDPSNIMRLLPHLSTDMIYAQGSKLSSALNLAGQMLAEEGSKNRTILVVSDGGFQDNDAFKKASEFAKQGVQIHAIGVGTKEGMYLVGAEGQRVVKSGKEVVSKLETDRLKELTNLGAGVYNEMHYSDRNAKAILNSIDSRSRQLASTSRQTRYWDEKFYLFIFPVMLIILFWFRRGIIFPLMLFILIYPQSAMGVNWFDRLVNNTENYAKKAAIDENYEEALEHFDDHYRKGVTQYRAGNYAEAEKEFAKNQRQEVELDSLYNLGNSLAKQQKFQQAIDAYGKVLAKDPHHARAKHNQKVVERLRELQQSQQSQQQKQAENEKESDSNSDDRQDQNAPQQDSQNDENKDEQQDDGVDEKQRDADPEEAEDQESESENNIGDEQEQGGATPEYSDEPLTPEDEEALEDIGKDPVDFLKNQFYLESMKQNNGKSNQNIDPW